MGRATKTELEWAFLVTRERILKQLYEKGTIPMEEWERVSKRLVDELLEDDSPIFETQMNAFLEKMVVKYLHPMDDFFSLTDVAKRYDEENPSYLIQSWLRSRNTIAFLGEWERHNNPDFDEKAFERLLIDVRSPSYTLTPKKWINTVNAIGMSSKRGKSSGTEAHPFIACDFEMWLDTGFRYEVLKYFMSSKVEVDDEEVEG